MARNKLTFLAFIILGLSTGNAVAEECSEQNAQSASCRGIKTYFYAKYKMDLAVGAGDTLLSLSCDLKRVSSQCRDYRLLATSEATREEMQEGCVSMGGYFHDQQCSPSGALASCRNIVRNYHRPDVIYSTLYYPPSQPNALAPELSQLKQTCQNLGGSFQLPNKSQK